MLLANHSNRTNLRYPMMRTLEQLKKDSRVALQYRNHHRILAHLDWLLERYWARAATLDYDKSIRDVVVCDLFFTANSWVTLFHQRHPAMEKGRYPAVLALFEASVEHL